MSLVVGITSSRTSPGVSSLSVGLAWAFVRRSLQPIVIEADSSGGVLGQRLGLSPQPSLSSLVREVADRFGPEVLANNLVQHLGVSYLQSSVDPAAAAASVEQLGRLMLASDFRPEVPTLVDLGRWSSDKSWVQMAKSVDHLMLVTSPRLEDVQSARFALKLLAELKCSAGLVVVGDQPFSPEEVADSLGVTLVGGVVYDPEVAAALRGGSYTISSYHKSLLGRSIDALASSVLGQV